MQSAGSLAIHQRVGKKRWYGTMTHSVVLVATFHSKTDGTTLFWQTGVLIREALHTWRRSVG